MKPRQRISNQCNTLFSLQIPKTGSTTLRGIIERQYQQDEILPINRTYGDSIQAYEELSSTQKHGIRVFQGHFGFGLHRIVSRPATYITVLRWPIDRVLSHYYHELRHSTSSDFYQAGKPVSLEEYIYLRKMNDNGQTRYLSCCDGDIWGDQIDFGECSLEMLEKAKRNLDEYFVVAGLLERFDESIILMGRELEWELPFYVKHRVASNRPINPKISQKALQTIETYNKLDIELYKYAQEKFDALVSQQSPSFLMELYLLRLMNIILERLYATRCSIRNSINRVRRL